MMLPPFRIRDLYGQARHGVVQITKPQYDSTVKSHPDAALTYLDEDDGETITVGSGFELSQRLDEPVSEYKAVTQGEDLLDENSNPYNLHTFDIQKSSNSIATWMDHEAYSSKSLRSRSLSSTTSMRSGSEAAGFNKKSTAQETEDLKQQEEGQATELDMYEEMYDKEVQITSPVSIEGITSTPTSSDGLLVKDQQSPEGVEKIVSDALEGVTSNLDSHIDTLADFLQNTSKALRMVAEKTRDNDTTAVESILSGFNVIFGEVGKLAKAVLEPFDAVELGPADSPVELDLQHHTTSSDEKGKARAVATEENELSASSEVLVERERSPSPVLATSPLPTVRVETLPAQRPRNPSSFQRGTEITARLPMSHLDRIYHIPSTSFIDGQPQEVCAEKDHMYATLERGGFNPDMDRTWKYTQLPDDSQVSKTKKKVDFAMPSGIIRPRETAKSSEPFQRSILDLEASDPDFSARFPPLLSVRRSKTMGSLRKRAQSPETETRTRQDALTRYPSLQQFERRKVLGRDVCDQEEETYHETTETEEKPLYPLLRTWFDSPLPTSTGPAKDVFARQNEEVEEVIAAVGRDITEASNEVRRLPGAWPEAQADAKFSHLPTSNESSGAFFNRMTGQGVRLDKKRHAAVEAPSLTEWQSFGEQGLYSRHKPKHLERAKSMASLKPSATLTTPFDPLVSPAAPGRDTNMHAEFEAFFNPTREDLLRKSPMSNGQPKYPTLAEAQDQVRSKHDSLRRSATERMPHRRPYSHRYSGAGRLPWENFEDRSFDLRTGSFIQRQERARRSADRPAPPPPTTRQNPSHPIRLPSDLHKRVHDYRSGLRHRASAPSVGIAKQSKINECIQQLKDMGFGNDDTNEASRLNIYAAATGGNIFEAVEMIEEDRKAVNLLKGRGQASGPENGPGAWL